MRGPGSWDHSPGNSVGTSPAQISVSPNSHMRVLQSQGTPPSTEARLEHCREPEAGGHQPQSPSSSHTSLPGLANPSPPLGLQQPGWHPRVLASLSSNTAGKGGPLETPSDSQRDLKELTGNRVSRKRKTEEREKL